jgi:hypothetical protein
MFLKYLRVADYLKAAQSTTLYTYWERKHLLLLKYMDIKS